ncbi:PREDICTED: uncharacterized protein LOC109581893 [Amphimedon queenslandica]|nr:PREDICTED: uncharacterized protein LOC109581893 [Amphimedon queenslandica]|eukprot:XP_019851929.1 PREDICTED: uncharacterized protein LOC109581893 [Amphimedon queenslandica]
MDNLDCLSDVQVAEKKLFLVQGEKPQLINWEKYGLRIGVQEDTLSPTNTVEVAVVALVGGEFVFPKNTVLVSAVYAVSVSKPLLKPLRLEIEHCIDLRGRPGLTQFLKFAIAPMSTPSLPYHFSVVQEGEFKADSWYGSIERKEFCLVSVVGQQLRQVAPWIGEEEGHGGNGGGAGGGGGQQTNEGEGGDQQQLEGQAGQTQHEVLIEGEHEEEEHDGLLDQGQEGQHSQQLVLEQGAQEPHQKGEDVQGQEEQQERGTTASPDDTMKPTGVKDAETYAGLVYYEKKETEDLVTFTAAKKLSALLEFIKSENSCAERGQNVYFSFNPFYSYIELKFDAPQEKPFTGWSIEPHLKPCRLRRCDVDNFGEANYPLPPCCLISVYGSPGAVPSLHYSVPLDGVADPVTLFIHRSLRTLSLPAIPVNPSPLPVPRKREQGLNLVSIRKGLQQALTRHRVDLSQAFNLSLTSIFNEMVQVGIVSNNTEKSYDAIITSLNVGMSFMKSSSDLELYCVKFLNGLSKVGGPVALAAETIYEEWTEASEGELLFDCLAKRAKNI